MLASRASPNRTSELLVWTAVHRTLWRNLVQKRELRLLAARLLRRAGFHLTPAHFYSSLADVGELRRQKDLWARRSDMPGIDANTADQLHRLGALIGSHEPEIRKNEIFHGAMAAGWGPGYGPIEAQVLHCVLRSTRPKRFVEIGSGVSTACALHALEMNQADSGHDYEVTCIEPYPSENLRSESRIKLVQTSPQAADGAIFEALEAGDVLFIDSTHTVKPGSEVNYLCLEVIPRLKPGVLVHIHDIYLPYDYQPDVLTADFQWSETTLVRALLVGNDKLKIEFCLSQLHYDEPSGLKELLPIYEPHVLRDGLLDEPLSGHFPSSLWLRTA